jgi:hypothetical protein
MSMQHCVLARERIVCGGRRRESARETQRQRNRDLSCGKPELLLSLLYEGANVKQADLRTGSLFVLSLTLETPLFRGRGGFRSPSEVSSCIDLRKSGRSCAEKVKSREGSKEKWNGKLHEEYRYCRPFASRGAAMMYNSIFRTRRGNHHVSRQWYAYY